MKTGKGNEGSVDETTDDTTTNMSDDEEPKKGDSADLADDAQSGLDEKTDDEGSESPKKTPKDDDEDNEKTDVKVSKKRGRKAVNGSASNGTPKKSPKKSKGSPKKNKPVPKTIENEEEYEVEKVVNRKKINTKVHYLIRWKGYSASDDTWEAEDTLNCPELIQKYNSQSKTPKIASKKSQPKKRKSVSYAKDQNDGELQAASPKKKGRKGNAGGEEKEEYEVEKILEVQHLKKGGREFLVRWKGYPASQATWEPEKNLNCKDLVKNFMLTVEEDNNQREMRENRVTTKRFTQQTGRRQSARNRSRKRTEYYDSD